MIHSHSSLSIFEQCPYKFKLRYIENITPPIKDTIESYLGKMVHQTLEKLYLDLQRGQRNSLDNSLQYLHRIWYENWNDSILIANKKYSMKHYFSLAKQFISNYYRSYEPFNQTDTVAIENHIIFPLDEENNYQIQGFIDRLSEKKSGHFQIHDYKTSSRLPTQLQLDKDRQLGLYTLGVKHLYPNAKTITLIWHYLKFNKELQSKRNIKQLNDLKTQVIRLIKKIQETSLFSCNISPLCQWCEYKPICPQYSNLYNNDNKNETIYLKQTGQQLVDNFVKTNNKTE